MSSRSARDVDEYADVLDMFTALREGVPESAEVASQRDAIITRCLVLAEHVARRYGGRGEDVEDLLQVARVGLFKAVDRFDPGKGTNFAAYAIPTMMGEVRRHFRDHGWSTYVPRRLKDRNAALNQAIMDLTQPLGRAPTAAQLAEHLDLSHEDVIEACWPPRPTECIRWTRP